MIIKYSEKIKEYMKKVICILKAAHIVMPKEAVINVYHHTGESNLDNVGACFINAVNRDYSKSYVVMLSGQSYPNHYHKLKMESFYVLYGKLDVNIEERNIELIPGEILHIDKGTKHSFSTEEGVVFEELSTKYVPNDSVYIDSKVNDTEYSFRRTTITMEALKEIASDG